jgi:alanine racemase
MNLPHRPAWIEVNLDHLEHNIAQVRKAISNSTKICAVVKADGYKLGVVQVAFTLINKGVDLLAVAILDEALEIREALNDCDVLVLGYTPPVFFEQAIEKRIALTIYNEEHAIELNDTAKKIGKTAKIHIKIETGMNRLGFSANEKGVMAVKSICRLSHVEVVGIYTHLARADEKDKQWSYIQKEKFDKFYKSLEDVGVKIPIRHMANSAAIIDLPEFQYEMVRPGIMITGLYPSNKVDTKKVDLKVVFKLKAQLSFVKWIAKGEGISYGHQFVSENPMKIGTIPIGYADGLSRLLTDKLWVSINGMKCKVLGRICMDQCLVDLTSLPDATIGDEVTIYGDGLDAEMTPDEVAARIGTINYEILTMLDRRLPRVYTQSGKTISVKNYLVRG